MVFLFIPLPNATDESIRPPVASGHLGLICPSNSDLVRGYRIEFTRRPPVTMEPRWTPLPRNTARWADLEKVHAVEEGNCRDSPLNGHTRVLFPNIPPSKRLRRLSPNSKSQSVESLHVDGAFPYGNPAYCDGLHRGGSPTSEEHLRTLEGLRNISDMSSLYQFERRLFSRPRNTQAHKISSLCLRLEKVQIPSAPLRSVYGPKGIHKDRKSKGTRGEYVPIPRLAPQKTVEGPHRSAVQSDALLGQQIGLSHEQREVKTFNNAPNGLPGVHAATSFVWWCRRRMVVYGGASQPYGGPTFPLPRSDDDNRNVRLHEGVGGSPGQLGGLRRMVDCLGQAPYQLARAPGGMAYLETLLAPVAWCCCGRLIRQCHDGSIHQQRGPDSVTLLVPTGTSGVDMVQVTPGGQPLFREQERLGGRSHQRGAPPPHRLVHAQSDGGANIRTLADPLRGSVCVREELQATDVLLSVCPSPTFGGSNALTQNWEHLYGYAFPPFSLIPRVLRKQVATVSPDPIGGTVLAQSTVVTSADEHAGGPPTGDLAPGQPPEELGHGNVLSRAAYLYGLCPLILC